MMNIKMICLYNEQYANLTGDNKKNNIHVGCSELSNGV